MIKTKKITPTNSANFWNHPKILVGVEDYRRLNKYKWYLKRCNGGLYAARGAWQRKEKRQITILMHRDIMCPLPGFEVDHRNGNTLDNRRKNLRITTTEMNSLFRDLRRAGIDRSKKNLPSKPNDDVPF